MHVISIINHMVLKSIRQLCPPHLHFSNNPSLLGLLRSLHTSDQLHTGAIKKNQTCHKTPFYFPKCNPATSNHTYLKYNIQPSIASNILSRIWDKLMASANPWRWRWELGSLNIHKLYLSKHAANSCFQILFARKLSELQIIALCFARQFLVIFQVF